jgi:hypothetical protein
MQELRTTIVLDEASRRAARQLARRWDCSISEAIRRALIRQRDALEGATAARRREKRRLLERLFELCDGNDAAAEVARLKAEDEGF